jgi:D-aminoacyl-tRNA deacylase
MQKITLLVHSNRDIAGRNIAQSTLQHYPFKKTSQEHCGIPIYAAEIGGKRIISVTLEEEAVNAQTLPEAFPNAELIVFISRHSSQSGTPTLSVHTPGNIGEAELGGLPRTVSVSPAQAMQTALKTLHSLAIEKNLAYEVSYEGTHHGPSLNVSTMFVELGSSELQWRDVSAAEVVGHAAIEAITKRENSETRTAVLGIGGTHYNQKFTQMALKGEAIFGHMIPKYALKKIDTSILRQCIERTQETVVSAILDWKGIRSEDKQPVLSMLADIGLPTNKI